MPTHSIKIKIRVKYSCIKIQKQNQAMEKKIYACTHNLYYLFFQPSSSSSSELYFLMPAWAISLLIPFVKDEKKDTHFKNIHRDFFSHSVVNLFIAQNVPSLYLMQMYRQYFPFSHPRTT